MQFRKSFVIALLLGCVLVAWQTHSRADVGDCGALSVSSPHATLPDSLIIIFVEFTDVRHDSFFTAGAQKYDNVYKWRHFYNELVRRGYYVTPNPNDPNSFPRSPAPENEAVYGSFTDYFDQMSFSKYSLKVRIANDSLANGEPQWIQLGNPKSYYRSSTPPYTDKLKSPFWRDAKIKAKQAGIDTTHNAQRRLCFVYAGNRDDRIPPAAELSGEHMDVHERWNGSGSYGIEHAADRITHIGMYCHEFTHILGEDHPSGTALWDILANGQKNSAGGGTFGNCPAPIDPWFRNKLNWLRLNPLTADGSRTLVYGDTLQNYFSWTVPADPNYKYIVENRQFTSGFDQGSPGHYTYSQGGILLWKVYTNSSVDLVEADGVKHENNAGDDIFRPSGSFPYSIIFDYSSPGNTKIGSLLSNFAIDSYTTNGNSITVNFKRSYLSSNSSNATASNNSRKLARDSNGAYHLVYETEGEVYYQKSTDGGSSWSGYKRLSSGNGNNQFPCIVERGGRVYVVWQHKNGTKYDIYFRKYMNNAWQTTTTLQADVGTTDPLPVFISPATDKLTVVYRDQKLGKLRYKVSTNDGGSWTTGDVPSTGSNDSSPTLTPTTTYWGNGTRSCLVYAYNSGSTYTIYYHYYRNGPDSTEGWNASRKNLSQIVPGSYSNHQKPSIAPSGTTGDKRLHVVWEATEVSSGSRKIIHRKATDWGTWPSVYSTTYYEEQQLPSITGLHDGTAELLFRMVSQNQIHKMHYDGTYWGAPVFVGEGSNPSVSVGNTTAKYVWTYGTTSPYQIKTSTETLSKSGGPLAISYHRSTAVIDTVTGAWFEVRINDILVKTKAGKELAIPLAAAQEDPLTLTPTKAFDNLASIPVVLPADAESLVVNYWNGGNGLSAIKNASSPLNVRLLSPPRVAPQYDWPHSARPPRICQRPSCC